MTDSDKASLLYSLGFGSYSDAMTYIEDKKEYDRYVRNTYTTVPENEKENIRRFIDEFEGKDGDNAGTVDNELLYVYGMCEYHITPIRLQPIILPIKAILCSETSFSAQSRDTAPSMPAQ